MPCEGTKAYEWRRSGQVVTFGDLVKLLGKKRSIRAIYHFFRTLRIVATKRKHDSVLGSATSGSANVGVAGLTGTTGTTLQPANLIRALKPKKTRLVKEYALVMGLHEVDETSDSLFRTAVRYLQVCLLSDLRPPWAENRFPQALPGNATLTRYTRPCFLQWEAVQASTLFGEEVMSKLVTTAAEVSLEAVGVLGRPLYVCTARPHENAPEQLCMSRAAMSPLMQLSAGRKHFLCAKCEKKLRVPVSDKTPLRVLHLFITVEATDGQPTPLRMKPLSVVVEAPPDSFAWGSMNTNTFDSESVSMAVPTPFNIARSRGRNVVAYSFNSEASKAIWCSAGAWRGEAPDAPL